jgi:putative flippase GtrA
MRARDYVMTFVLASISGAVLLPLLSQAEALPFRLTLLSALVFMAGLIALEIVGLCIAGVLARRLPFMQKFARFCATGVFNTVLDTGILTSLAYATDVYAGWLLAGFNIISFSATMVLSYVINRTWSFDAGGAATMREFLVFTVVGTTSMLINTALVFVLTTLLQTPAALTSGQWVLVAKVIGVCVSLIWNFAWFHLFVFKAKPSLVPR